MRALVTGARGHTGSFLVKLLLEKGWEVVATDLPPRERSKVMKKEKVFRDDLEYMDVTALDGVEFVPADLTVKDSLRALFRDKPAYDVIFHPASLYDYFALLEDLRRINVGGLRNFLEVVHEECGGKFPRFVHWSTCGVYGEPEYERDPETKAPLPADETAPYDPPNAYSVSKMEQELALKELAEKWKFPYTIIRPAPIYGPYQLYGAFHIFYLLNKMGHMVLPHVYPRHKRLMMPAIHVESLVEAAAFLSQRDDAVGEAYNVVEDAATQEDWMEFTYQQLGITYTNVPVWWPFYKLAAKFIFWYQARENKKARKWGIRPKFDLSMAGYIVHQYYFSNAKLKALGFKFKHDIYSGTARTIRWYKDRGWLESEEFPFVTPPTRGVD